MTDMDVAGQALPALSLSDLDISADEPRITDVRLAAALGYSKVQDLRQLAERHRETLERFGGISTHRASKIGRGRPSQGMAFNKRQAVYLAAKSETPRAVDITIAVVEVFDRATSAEPSAGGPPFYPSCDTPPLPPPAEPPFCIGCAARSCWRADMAPAHHPLAQGPLTASELAFIVLLRGEMTRREAGIRDALIQKLSAALGGAAP